MALWIGMWSWAFSAGVPIGWRMLRVQKRVENVERLLRMKTRPAHVIRINSIDMDGQVVGTMMSSSDPALCVPYRRIDDDRKDAT